jgi:hypothetical protein
MDESSFMAVKYRHELNVRLAMLDDLLFELIEESGNMPDWAKKKFNERLRIIRSVVDAVEQYDVAMQRYIEYHPIPANVDSLKQRLRVAQRYVEALGGDWSTVTWLNPTDFH